MPDSRSTTASSPSRTTARIGLTCAAAVALLGTGVIPSAAATADSGPGAYVALGDSYAAGSGIPAQSAGLCFRSDHNYPSLVARQLNPATTRDVTCGAAKVKHMTEPQGYPVVGQVNAAQFEALRADTGLVTLTIGGNDLGAGDLGMAELVVKCVALAATNPVGSPCRKSYGSTLDDRINTTGPRIADTLQEIHRRSPQAKILVTGYPAVLPENEWDCLFVQPVTVHDAAYLRDTLKKLNSTIAEQARANGATYVDVYTPTVGHDICQERSERWVEGIIPSQPTMPVHPNARGEQAMAEAVIEAAR